MPLNSLEDAFVDELRDVLSAEKQLVKALPKMAKSATSEQLRDAIEAHLEETKSHVERVEAAFESLELKPRAKKCDAMEGLLEEGASILEEEAAPEVLDALIIAAAQKVEHYEIATYGTLCTWAEALGHGTALKLLKQNLSEEEAADEKLSALSETVNEAALMIASDDDEE
ncbi:YciE/YciF ferroxidase family protein [Planctomicrobium piriforme]|uniref:Ferritin-like metal-binding protein YciE n=1 Tax=Planctomicrobium piriforme TaxID=1576369 RepID=A0A1I3RUF6_9PLAN|nr:ferritin-like domain-containing protein [Planctomicrobium piriforme]SFJ50193.1 Ferritin-like metal-binding protein YciE [Planctomicrobium piriforme]